MVRDIKDFYRSTDGMSVTAPTSDTEASSTFKEDEKVLLRAILENRGIKCVLEAGAGIGRGIEMMVDILDKVYALDISTRTLIECRRRLSAVLSPKDFDKITFFNGDFESWLLPLGMDKPDLVTFLFQTAFNSTPASRLASISNLARVSRSVVISGWNGDGSGNYTSKDILALRRDLYVQHYGCTQLTESGGNFLDEGNGFRSDHCSREVLTDIARKCSLKNPTISEGASGLSLVMYAEYP